MRPLEQEFESAPFLWPPKQVQVSPAPLEEGASFTPRPAKRSRRNSQRIFEEIRRFEDFWLAPQALPLAVRLTKTNWRADPPGAFCERCGHSIGPYETDEFGCAECRNRKLPWRRFIRLGDYRPPLSMWILEGKFRRQQTLAHDLGAMLGESIRAAGADANLGNRRLVVVPVAVAWSRRFVRDFDHADEIARGVARTLRAPIMRPLRRKHRRSQRSVPASRRPSNVRGSFTPRRNMKLAGLRILLIDDVRTTGSTLREAGLTLRAMGADDIWIGVLASTPTDNRRPAAERAMNAQNRVEQPVYVENERIGRNRTERPLDNDADGGRVAAPANDTDRSPGRAESRPGSTL